MDRSLPFFPHFFLNKNLITIFSDGRIATTEDIAGWKSKLKVPPKDTRIKTSVSQKQLCHAKPKMLKFVCYTTGCD